MSKKAKRPRKAACTVRAVAGPQRAVETQNTQEVTSSTRCGLPKIVIATVAVVVLAVAVLACVYLPRIVAFNCYCVPSESMETTLMTGDYIYSDRACAEGKGISVGDIVTFFDGNNSSDGNEVTFVKRVVAVAGQTVSFEDGKVYVDGVALDEGYAQGMTAALEGSQVMYPYSVPEGYVWVMGDNREHSADSRYFGAVPLGNITGKVVGICWPLSRAGAVE